jgi:hypothetical protein
LFLDPLVWSAAQRRSVQTDTHQCPGKSSLLLRFTDDDFLSEEETSATIGVDFKVKSLEVEGKRYKLSIWVSRGFGLDLVKVWAAGFERES